MCLSVLYTICAFLLDVLLPRGGVERAREIELLALRHEVWVLRRQIERTRWALSTVRVSGLWVPVAGAQRIPAEDVRRTHERRAWPAESDRLRAAWGAAAANRVYAPCTSPA